MHHSYNVFIILTMSIIDIAGWIICSFFLTLNKKCYHSTNLLSVVKTFPLSLYIGFYLLKNCPSIYLEAKDTILAINSCYLDF